MLLTDIPRFDGEDKKGLVKEFLKKIEQAAQGQPDASKLALLRMKVTDHISQMITRAVTNGSTY